MTSECSFHQPTGSFCYESALRSSRYSSTPAHSLEALASHCIRVSFGERVQLVADSLQAIGAGGTAGEHTAVTLSALWTFFQRKQQCVTTYVSSSMARSLGSQSQHPFAANSNENSKKSPTEQATFRSALLVLIQHSIVSIRRKQPTGKKGGTRTTNLPYTYRYHPDRAIRLGGCRYARYVEYMKRALQDPTAATVVETLLLHGRLRTIDLVLQTVQQQQQQQQQSFSDQTSTTQQHHKYTARETIVDALAKLVRGGFLEPVPHITLPQLGDDDEGEHEFGEVTKTVTNSSIGTATEALDEQQPPTKKVKIELGEEASGSGDDTKQSSSGTATIDNTNKPHDEDPAVVNLLRSNAQYKSALPIDSVWRVNQGMFHDSIRALRLGRLVAELYNHRVRWAGSLVTGALKYRAHLEHASGAEMVHTAAAAAEGTTVSGGGGTGVVRASDTTFFTPNDVIKYLPKSVVQLVETEANKTGLNTVQIIYKAFLDLSKIRYPTTVVRRVGEDSFEIAHASLLDYLRRRMIHQAIEDRHGPVAARVLEILWQQGWLESDHLAKTAMVPAKETRAILHELYRNRYIELFQLSTSQSSKQYFNHHSSIYLWCVHPNRLRQRVIDNVLTAARNLNVRRQHESEVVGREWIERAQRQMQEDENEHETDKLNYQKFCLGLERIDVALHQLDETLLALADF